MNVSFLENNPLNTVVLDSSNGRPLYEVQTPYKLIGSRTTTVRRLKPGVAPGAGEIIAEVHWHRLSADTITLYGSTMRVNDWLRKSGMYIFISSRIFTASDGKSYKWSYGSGKFTLKDTNTKGQVAQSHRRKRDWFGGTPRKMNIDISPQGIQFLDTIVVSFIIMEEQRREANDRSTAAAIASNTNAIAAASGSG